MQTVKFKGLVDGNTDSRINLWIILESQGESVDFQYKRGQDITEISGTPEDIEALSERLKQWGYEEA